MGEKSHGERQLDKRNAERIVTDDSRVIIMVREQITGEDWNSHPIFPFHTKVLMCLRDKRACVEIVESWFRGAKRVYTIVVMQRKCKLKSKLKCFKTESNNIIMIVGGGKKYAYSVVYTISKRTQKNVTRMFYMGSSDEISSCARTCTARLLHTHSISAAIRW